MRQYMKKQSIEMSVNTTVLLTTFERYETTLPICLLSLANQSRRPDRIVLVDDNREKMFYESSQLKSIVSFLKLKGIQFDYYHGQSKGATYALQIGLEKIGDGWVFKLDDDNSLEYDVLELFEKNISKNVGAIGGLIIDTNIRQNIEEGLYPKCVDGHFNKIENIFSEFNIQLIQNQTEEIKKVEHIYSNYFFRRDLVDSYPLELSPSCHREDTIMTHGIFRKGYDLLVIPKAKTYHLHSNKNSGDGKWEHLMNQNELVFIEKMKQWGVIPSKLEIIEEKGQLFAKKNKDSLFSVVR